MNEKEYKLAIKIAGTVDKSYTEAMSSANTQLAGFKTIVNAMDEDFTKLDKGFDKVWGVGKKCFSAVAAAASVAATAISAATMASINIGSEFEAQMSVVQAISNATESEMELLTEKARELGESSIFSATEVGNAMEYMGMAGWETEQILDGIDGVLALAAASGEDFSLVADIVTDDLTAFNMEAEETNRMINVLAQAAMNSNTTIEKMGETFQYAGAVAGAMNYSIEDMAIATGLMASAGIKDSSAGTALRNIITRMAKPTRESSEAMEALGLSLEKDSGEMYSFLEIMQQVRSGMENMTETQKAYYAAELAGQRGMTGLLAIANASDEEFQKLTDAIYNAEGAAQCMAEIRMNNLSGDIEILTDTLSDAGIELYYQFNDELRSITQKGSELINDGTTKIPQLFQKISTEFPTLKRKFSKYAQPVLNIITGTGKWIVKNGKGIISILAGIGATMASYKVASSGVHFINMLLGLSKLHPATLGILGLTVALGGLATAFTAYKQKEKELINENLASHFGNITLSLKELRDVAEYVTKMDGLDSINEALSAFDELETYKQTMDDAVSELDRMNWKVSIGMILKEDEQESYKQSIADYIEAAEDYAAQAGYAVSLNLSATFDTGDLEQSNVVEKINQFYLDKYDELRGLGTRLNEAITEAFNDGLLEIDEIEKITQIQQDMAEIEKQLAVGEYEATLSVIKEDFSAAGLTPDSFLNLIAEINAAEETVTEAYNNAYKKNYASATAAYNGGALSDEEYQAALDQALTSRNNSIAEAHLQSLQFELNTIYDLYGEDIAAYNDAVARSLNEWADPSHDFAWMTDPDGMWERVYNTIGEYGPDDITRKSIYQLTEQLAGDMEWINQMAAELDTLSPETQEHLLAERERLMDALGAADDIEGLYYDLADHALGSDLYDGTKMRQATEEYWDTTYEELVGHAYKQAQIAAEQIAGDTQDLLNESFSTGFSVSADVYIDLAMAGLETPGGTSNLLAGAVATTTTRPAQGSGDYLSTAQTANRAMAVEIDHNAAGGIIQNRELSWLAENGPEAVIPLNGSRRAQSLWEKAGQLLGMDSIFERYDISGGGQNTITIEHNPTLQFYGAAPSREEISEALKIDQDEFERMLERYFRSNSRVSFSM